MGSLVSVLQHRLFNLNSYLWFLCQLRNVRNSSSSNLKMKKEQGKTPAYTWHFSCSSPLWAPCLSHSDLTRWEETPSPSTVMLYRDNLSQPVRTFERQLLTKLLVTHLNWQTLSSTSADCSPPNYSELMVCRATPEFQLCATLTRGVRRRSVLKQPVTKSSGNSADQLH